jgi:hypothetical protein
VAVAQRARENIDAAQKKQATNYNKRIGRRTKPVEVGCYVMRRNAQKMTRNGGRLEPDFLGPYICREINGKRATLAKVSGEELQRSVSVDHLKVVRGPKKDSCTSAPDGETTATSRGMNEKKHCYN